jgi:hypothetical protein
MYYFLENNGCVMMPPFPAGIIDLKLYSLLRSAKASHIHLAL